MAIGGGLRRNSGTELKLYLKGKRNTYFFRCQETMDEEVGLLENNPTVKTQVSELLNERFSDFELSFGKLFY